MQRHLVLATCSALALTMTFAPAALAQSPGSAFTYQGHLDNNGEPVNGTADLQFTLWNSGVTGGGVQVGPTLTLNAAQITGGFFSANLDFGATAWDGNQRWLEVASRVPAGGGTFSVMPRQPVLPVPYALRAVGLSAGNIGLGGVATPNFPLTFPSTLGDKISLWGNANQHFGFGVQSSQLQVFTDSVNADVTFGFKNAQGTMVETVRIQNDGRIGIGTNNARSALHAVGNANTLTLEGVDHTFIEFFPDGIAAGRAAYLGFAGAASDNLVVRNSRMNAHIVLGTTGAGGNVGIGLADNAAPTAKLEVGGGVKASAFQLTGNGAAAGRVLGSDASGNASWILAPGGSQWTTSGSNIHFNSGNVGIGTSSPTTRLDVEGAATMNSLDVQGVARVNTLEIDAGADLAENFDIACAHVGDEVVSAAPGMVVSIDARHIGKLVVTSKAYDRTVAGIVSGAGGVNPGLTLSQPGTVADGEHPVASVGRVWCYVDADAGGPVEPGDTLTTSDTPGHAMRATDETRAPGATIGKAMSSLREGRGLVLVLVSLQ